MEQEKGVLQMKGRWPPYLANVNEVYVGILICSFRIHFHQCSGWLHKTGAWALFGRGPFFPNEVVFQQEKANSWRVGKVRIFLRYILSLRSFGWFSIVSYHWSRAHLGGEFEFHLRLSVPSILPSRHMVDVRTLANQIVNFKNAYISTIIYLILICVYTQCIDNPALQSMS